MRAIVKEILNNSILAQKMTQKQDICIIGPPNSGKSTLMNLLCQDDVSIVTDIEGTTRDVLEVYIF